MYFSLVHTIPRYRAIDSVDSDEAHILLQAADVSAALLITLIIQLQSKRLEKPAPCETSSSQQLLSLGPSLLDVLSELVLWR